MAGTQLRIILDDNTSNITYGGGQWSISSLAEWYQGTSFYPAFATSGNDLGSMSLSFEGSSIAFIGNIPPLTLSQTANVSIDGGTPNTITYVSSINPPSYVQWYQSPTLSDGKHKIVVDGLAGTALDMALITVGPNTPLAGNKIFVDNDDSALRYSGSWAESTDGFDSGFLPDGLPIGNSTMRTTTPGDTMTFQFFGTSVSVYGLFSWTSIGSISATYTLDGTVSSQSYPVTINSAQHINNNGEDSNFLFFDKDNLSAGPHTLVLNITDVQNQMFILDYIVYSPSFESLATMPNVTTVILTTTKKATPTLTSSGPTTTNTSAIPSQTTVDTDQGHTSIKPTPTSAIIGGILGGVLFVVSTALLLLCLCRRSSRVTSYGSMERRSAANIANSRLVFGHPTSSARVVPFPTTTPSAGFASISDLKRNRLDQNRPRDASSSSYGVRVNTALHNPARNDGASESQPPAYDALSAHTHIASMLRQ